MAACKNSWGKEPCSAQYRLCPLSSTNSRKTNPRQKELTLTMSFHNEEDYRTMKINKNMGMIRTMQLNMNMGMIRTMQLNNNEHGDDYDNAIN